MTHRLATIHNVTDDDGGGGGDSRKPVA